MPLDLITRAVGGAKTLDRAGRTVEVVAVSGPAPAVVTNRKAPDGSARAWVEELDVAGADLSGFAGRPALRGHRATVEDAVGVVEAPRVEAGQIVARVRFDGSAEADTLINKIEVGSVRGVSVGYLVQRWQPAGTRNGLPVFRAAAWTPHELSFAPVPVDPGAHVRSKGALMPDDIAANAADTSGATDTGGTTTTTADTGTRSGGADLINRAALNGQIRSMARSAGLGADVADGLIDRGATLEESRGAVFDAMLARSAGRPLAAVQVLQDHDDPSTVIDRMATAYAARATEHLPERHRVAMPEAARSYAGRSLLSLAAELADRRGSPIGRYADPSELYQRALTTSDFPQLLANTANKTMLPAYQAAAPSYRRFFSRRDFKDFKPASFLRVGDFPAPLAVGEMGEYKHGSISESGESITLGEYGRIVMFSRKALINDDLGAFADLPTKAALRVADWENSVAWAMVASNPTMADGYTLFDATHHGNQSGSGGAISVTTVGAGEAALMSQTSLDGLKLNLRPAVLATSPTKYVAARQFCTTINPTTADAVNPFGGVLAPIADANLSGNGWYLFAEPTALETFVYGYLQGQSGPVITPEPGFDVAGVKVKLTIDFAVGAVDHRGAYYNAGA